MMRVEKYAAIEDARDVPAYGVAEAAAYLQIPPTTLRSWVVGRRYPVRGGSRRFEPLIRPAGRDRVLLLSFFNLVEAHVLDAIRHVYRIDVRAVRNAIDFLEKRFHSRHPLADRPFLTDGKDLFIKELGRLIAVSAAGQTAMRDVLEAHLRRIERDAEGVAAGLCLFTRGGPRTADSPRVVIVDPRVHFGRPVLAGTGIPTAVIAERFKAGESIEELVADYGRSAAEIQEALRCEQSARDAA
ncbi:MAG: putative antitoxin VapB45 [Planctomycetes bacterium]|nr:putative antitoxin VapB45 [Planctomycetota bacterium]